MTTTTMHPLPENTPNSPNTNQPKPPTYAESTRSNTSYANVTGSDRGHPLSPTSVIVQDHTAQQQKQEQIINGSEKKPSGRFNQRFHSVTSKIGSPLNRAANVIGAEGWWPTGMEKECSKAARILHSFTTLEAPSPPTKNGPVHPTGLTRKSMVKIPEAVLQSCAGLAIFNVLRAGTFHGSLAAGSGLVVARLPDGRWSPPSSFVVSTVGVGFTVGIDVYDCVCVLNTPEQLHAFTRPRFSLGGAASIAVGPVGAGSSVNAALSSRTAKPMWSYIKSRGLWAGVQIDGTVIVTRADANSVFYREKTSAGKILAGEVAWPESGAPLLEVLKAVDGRADLNRSVLQEVASQPAPGDVLYDDEKAAVEVASKEVDSETAEEEKARLAATDY